MPGALMATGRLLRVGRAPAPDRPSRRLHWSDSANGVGAPPACQALSRPRGSRNV